MLTHSEIYDENFFYHEKKFVEKNEQVIKSYFENAILGREKCNKSKVAVVSLARNCQKNLQKSINLILKLRTSEFKCFIYENDSIDETKEILKKNVSDKIQVSFNTDNSVYLTDSSKTRTTNLSRYRNRCVEWVKKKCFGFDYVIVLDLDADLGFSINGIYNSIYWLDQINNSGGMGSYSMFQTINKEILHYDTFAIRINKWYSSTPHRQEEKIFQNYHPKIGGNPIPFYSCFGGLAVYRLEAFVKGQYSSRYGCEHVAFHKTIKDAGYKMYLNPSSRFFAVKK